MFSHAAPKNRNSMSSKAAKEVIALYQRHFEVFDRLRDKSLFEKDWLDAFWASLPDPAGRILDLGCGSGDPIAAYLISKGGQISGLDGSLAMIQRARTAFPAQHWLVADMRVPPRLGRFDGILAWHSLFHLTPDDQRAMFEVFGRLSQPGAALLFTSGGEYGEVLGSLAGEALYHASLDASEYRELLLAHQFELVQHRSCDPHCRGAAVWLAKRRVL